MKPLLPLLAATSLTAASPLSQIEADTRWIDFGQLEIGDTATESVELRNTGQQPVEILDIDLSGDDFFQVASEDCERVLDPGETCEIEIEFLPEETGSFESELEIETSLGDLDITVQGEAVQD